MTTVRASTSDGDFGCQTHFVLEDHLELSDTAPSDAQQVSNSIDLNHCAD